MRKRPAYPRKLDRLFANIIDSFLLFLGSSALVAIGGANSAMAVVGVFLFTLGYYVGFTSSRWQATPGKRMLELYVVRMDGMPLSQRDALERFLGYALPSLPLYLSIASEEILAMATVWLSMAWFGPILLRDDGRGVHDVLCGTVVLAGKK